MSPSVFYLTVLILWAVSIFLIVEATGRTKLRKEYPGRKDEALRTLTFSTSLLSAAAMVRTLAVFLIAIAGGYSSRENPGGHTNPCSLPLVRVSVSASPASALWLLVHDPKAHCKQR